MNRPAAVVSGALVVLALSGCASDGTEAIGPVSIDVPDGWERDEPTDGSDDLIEEERWRQGGQRSATLQVIVGCGDADADQLRLAASEAYHLANGAEATDVEVAGLDTAQRISWELTVGPMGETGAFRIAGLYGAGSGGLVIVEFGALTDAYDPTLAEEVLDSVEVAPDELAAACAGPDG